MPKVDIVIQALNTLDSDLLSSTQVSSLIKEFITDDELAEMKEKDDVGVVWEKAEAFMLALSKLPFAKTRLVLWSFMYDFEDNKEGIIIAIKSFKLVIYIKYNTIIILSS